MEYKTKEGQENAYTEAFDKWNVFTVQQRSSLQRLVKMAGFFFIFEMI